MADKTPLDMRTVRRLLSAYVKYGASGMWRVDPKTGEAKLPMDGSKSEHDILPSELKKILEDILHEPGKIPPEWADLVKGHNDAQSAIRDKLDPSQKKQFDAFWDNLKNAGKGELDALENSVTEMDPAVRDAIKESRRERQSFASRALTDWLEANPQPQEGDDKKDDKSDGQDQDKQQGDGKEQFDEDQMDEGDPSEQDGSDKSDGDGDEDGDDDGSGDGDGDESEDGDGEGDSDSDSDSDGDGKGKGKGKGQGQPQDGDGEGDGEGQPQDGQQGKGQGKGKPGEGKPGQGKGQQGQPDKFDDNSAREDSQPGHEEWLKQLEDETQKQEQKNEQQQQADTDAKEKAGETSDADGEDGKGKGKDVPSTRPRDNHPEGVFNLSENIPNKEDVEAAKQAFARLISRGRNNPTRLPRWKMNDLTKRLSTFRNPKPAKKPTLERKAIVFIIDNSPSMAHLERESRALAAALSASGGPGGADVIVCLSSNGDYSSSRPLTAGNHDGAWFRNGKLMGLLPKPAPGSGVDESDSARCWEWFLRKYLPGQGVEVQLIGIYGDSDGTRQWAFISNVAKGVRCIWFNPTGKGAGIPIEEVYNPDLTHGGIGRPPGYVPGDKRYEKFTGRYFIRVDTVRDIANALRKVAGM